MEFVYTITLFVHLGCAMLFIGWGFAKLFVVAPIQHVIGHSAYENVQTALSKKVWKIYPANMMLLIFTGSILFTKYFTFSEGLFPTTFQTLLILKASLAYVIGIRVAYAISKRLFCKSNGSHASCACSRSVSADSQDPNPVRSSAYYYIFAIGVTVVILAKLMFLV
ncbi:MAG: hypothetical protein RBR12_09330 [Sulfurospirillum cavolei]|uniref:hypothetical protein n=1 Tax=Sulfurospirillum cavolei TaxID=366522 RepID=UPI0005AA7564|nr:hypothetical protein [Sulfurospirillum cavolei]MDY0265364.1 hypothetical protein [Sulfurospirillum cavolei]